MDLTKMLERRAKRWPGIVQVASLLAAIAALLLHKPEKELAVWETALVLFLAILLYVMGTTLDEIVFDPLYGLKPSSLRKRAWGFVARGIFSPIQFIVDNLPGTSQMAHYRKLATEELRGKISRSTFIYTKEEDCQRIYNDAKTLLESSEEWDDHVKPWLEMSKAIRSFVWPLLTIFVYDLGHGRWSIPWLDTVLRVPVLNLLALRGVSLAALLLALVLYIWLRAFHMRAMYKLVKNSEYIPFPMRPDWTGEFRTAIPARHLTIGETSKKEKDETRPAYLLVAR
jgi:hypothetical protein